LVARYACNVLNNGLFYTLLLYSYLSLIMFGPWFWYFCRMNTDYIGASYQIQYYRQHCKISYSYLMNKYVFLLPINTIHCSITIHCSTVEYSIFQILQTCGKHQHGWIQATNRYQSSMTYPQYKIMAELKLKQADCIWYTHRYCFSLNFIHCFHLHFQACFSPDTVRYRCYKRLHVLTNYISLTLLFGQLIESQMLYQSMFWFRFIMKITM
jgi:hypothetical protein